MFFRKIMSHEPQTCSIQYCRDMLDFIGRLGSCCALQSHAEIKSASDVVNWLGLPPHHDPQKNWDTLKSLYYIVKNNGLDSPVLDAGASANSAILKWLSLLGYRTLYACDIRETSFSNYDKRKINFSIQDMTLTNYPDNYFYAVTSISVIEHGVPLHKFIKEMHRIIKPGGVLLISTDYWSEPIDCSGIFPYGREMGEMKIFQPGELNELCRMAESEGFQLAGPLDLGTKDKAVRWDRVDREYTFAFIALRKK